MGTLGYDPYDDLALGGPTAQEAERGLDLLRAVRSCDPVAIARAAGERQAEARPASAWLDEEPEPRRVSKVKDLAQANRRLLAENRRLRARLDGAMRQIEELRQALACQRA